MMARKRFRIVGDPIEAKVLSAIAEAKRIPAAQIDPESLLSDLQVDSLDIVTLIFQLEEELQITIPDERVRSVRTVRDVIEGVRALTAQSDCSAP
jgi:acyl carrier protein